MVHWAGQVSMVATKLAHETLKILATNLLLEDDGIDPATGEQL
jgi:hypothetical protein